MPKEVFADCEIYYEDRGDGEPLVLIPGFASGAWSWEKQTEALSRNFRVITFDPRGVANSSIADDAEVSIRGIADDVVRLMDALGIGEAHAVGISFGGFVAQELAIKYPERVKKLVLACTSFGGPNHVAAVTDIYAAFVSMEGLNSAERIRKYLSVSFAADTDPDVVERFCTLRERNPIPERVYTAQLMSAMSFNAEERVPAIAANTLVITGDRDPVVPMKNSLNLVDAIPHAHLAVIPYAGHMAFVERADEFNRIVEDFLLA
jgi:pimeloyl-ACP methyl ester carboxylesterase